MEKELKILPAKKDVLRFTLKGFGGAAYMNALRRYMMTEVPTMAIDEIEFRKNSSILYDEIIALRLGLLSLRTDLKSYELPPKDGVRSAKHELKLTLKAKGPGMVYASDLKSKDPAVKPVYPKTPIVKLTDGQELELEATAILGRGADHTKFTPCLAYYQRRPEVKIKSQPEKAKEISEMCPRSVFEFKSNKLSVKDSDQCILCNQCLDLAKGSIEITSDDEYLFTIESWGQLSEKDIFRQALSEFDDQIEQFAKAIQKAE
ncbi:MAG: DNA-directed RNA polymerase subunit D [Candidatus Woesearchaeota archaeon]